MSKASLVLTQLEPPISVFSNTLTCLVSVGRAIQHLLLPLCTQPLNELAEVNLQGQNLTNSCRREEHCSNISYNNIVSWKLYILLGSPKFANFIDL